MSDILVLSPKELDDTWLRGILHRVSRLDRAPEARDLRSKTIRQNEKWTGPVASLYNRRSVASLGTKSGLETRLVGFQPSPGQGNKPGIELIRGEVTSAETLSALQGVFEELGFMVFVCRDQAGGILPRVLASLINEAAHMAWVGIAPIEKIDAMMRLGANFPVGPFQWADQIGLDRILDLLENLSQELGPHYQPCPWIRRKVEAGKLGVKTGEGFYKYGAGGDS